MARINVAVSPTAHERLNQVAEQLGGKLWLTLERMIMSRPVDDWRRVIANAPKPKAVRGGHKIT